MHEVQHCEQCGDLPEHGGIPAGMQHDDRRRHAEHDGRAGLVGVAAASNPVAEQRHDDRRAVQRYAEEQHRPVRHRRNRGSERRDD